MPSFSGGYVPGLGQPVDAVGNYELEVLHYTRHRTKDLTDHALTESDFVLMLADNLQGGAKEWYRQVIKEESLNGTPHPTLSSVSGWLTAIRAQFVDPNIELATMARFNTLVMGKTKGALKAYNRAVNECLSLLGRMNPYQEKQNKFDYMQGLTATLVQEANRLPTFYEMTLQELQQYLERTEMNTFDFSAFTPTYTPYPGGPTPMELGATQMGYGGRRGRGGERGGRGGRGGRGQSPAYNRGRERFDRAERNEHPRAKSKNKGRSPSRGRPQTDAERALRNERREKGLCFECGKAGHRADECRNGKSPENGRGAQ